MIFTPLSQEKNYKEFKALSKTDDLSSLYFRKTNSFLFNEQKANITKQKEKAIRNCFSLLLKDPYVEMDTFYEKLYECYLDFVYKKFLKMNYLWIVQILNSEDHSYLIEKFQKELKQNIGTKAFAYFIFNNYMNYKLVEGDLDTFHKIDDVSFIKIGNIKIFKAIINGFSFNIKDCKKQISINDYYQKTNAWRSEVFGYEPQYHTFEYRNFIKVFSTANFIYKNLNSKKWYYFNTKYSLKTNIQDHTVLKYISQLDSNEVKIVIKNGFLMGIKKPSDLTDNELNLFTSLFITLNTL